MEHDHDRRGHAPATFGTIFAIVAGLNIALVIGQVVYGLMANSVALLADAGHNFGDALSLILAWSAEALSRRQPTQKFTYGFRSSTILAALANGILLLVATGAIALEAIKRLLEPSDVAGTTVIAVAAAAIVVNGLSAWLLMAGRKGDLNVRSAFLHMVADAGISAGVVVAGAAILLTGWNWIDPVVSLVISAVIVWGAWDLLREATTLSLAAVPAEIDPGEVRHFLRHLPGVSEVHDLHIWAMSTRETALTCHLIIPAGHPGDQFLGHACHELKHRFAIDHATLQIELADSEECGLASDHVI